MLVWQELELKKKMLQDERKAEERRSGRKRSKEDSDDEEKDEKSALRFDGGIWRVQLRCEIRRKVIAGKGWHFQFLLGRDIAQCFCLGQD